MEKESPRVQHEKINGLIISEDGEFTFPHDVLVCNHCDKAHDPSSEDFITIAGNIYVGLDGGLVGNVFDKEWRVSRLYILCRDGCAIEFLQEAVLDYCRPRKEQ